MTRDSGSGGAFLLSSLQVEKEAIHHVPNLWWEVEEGDCCLSVFRSYSLDPQLTFIAARQLYSTQTGERLDLLVGPVRILDAGLGECHDASLKIVVREEWLSR